MKRFKVFAMLLCFVSSCLSTKENSDKCDKVKPISNFVSSKIENKWYAQEITGQHSDMAEDCLLLDYKKNEMKIQNKDPTPTVVSMRQSQNTSKFKLKYNGLIGKVLVNFNVVILDTDFKDFAIAYVCLRKKGSAVILTRNQNPKIEIINEARRILKKNGFKVDNSTMTTINQSECN